MLSLTSSTVIVNGKTILHQDIYDRIYTDLDSSLVLLTGSLVEGLGNLYSDLDILVLSDTIPSHTLFDSKRHNEKEFTWFARSLDKNSGSWSTHEYFGREGLHIDIEYMNIEDVKKDFLSLESRLDLLVSPKHLLEVPFARIPGFSNRKKQILHRVLTGLPLVGKEILKSLQAQIDTKVLSLSNYLDIRLGYTNFKDIMGAYRVADWNSTLYLLRKRLLEQLRGLTHLSGNNNINDKWHAAYLKKYKDFFPNIVAKITNVMDAGKNSMVHENELIECSASALDLCFDEARHLLNNDFSHLIDCQILEDAHRKLYERKDLSHPHIRMAFAYEQRFYAAPKSPLILFFSKQ